MRSNVPLCRLNKPTKTFKSAFRYGGRQKTIDIFRWINKQYVRVSVLILKQGYLVERLKSSFRKFYGRYGDLVEQYVVTLSRMLNDILTLDQQWPPYRSDFPPISWPLYRAWPSPNYEWFPWSICNGCDMPAGNAYPSGTPGSVLHFGTC